MPANWSAIRWAAGWRGLWGRYLFTNDSGTGADADRITDVVSRTDRLNFALLDADAAIPGNQAFSFLGTAAFTNTSVGQIGYHDSGADLLVQIDTDGNDTVDMEVVLKGLARSALTSGVFVL